MTEKEAWANIRNRLIAYARDHGWTVADCEAEVMAYNALCGDKRKTPLLREKEVKYGT